MIGPCFQGAGAGAFAGIVAAAAEFSVALTDDVSLAVGGQNVFDVFSDRNDLLADALGVPWSQFTPWGFSGAYYYTRLNYGWRW